jgi:hypothetical protein
MARSPSTAPALICSSCANASSSCSPSSPRGAGTAMTKYRTGGALHAALPVPNVVFSCGMVRQDDGTLIIYYSGNDTVLNVGFSHEDVLAELCTHYGQNPLTGHLLYPL